MCTRCANGVHEKIIKMQYNLLQKLYDKQCDMFLNGHINLETFMYLENLYNLKHHLFIINLN